MKIILLNDTVDLENWGAQAGVDALKSILRKKFPSAEIKSFTYKWIAQRYLIRDPLFGKKVFPLENKSLVSRFSKEFQFLPLVADEFEFIANQWLNGIGGPQAKDFINSLNGVDFIIFNAEGSTYRNNFTAIKALFLLWFAKTKFDIPGFFVNGSVSITHVDPILPAMVKKTFSVLNGIAVREPFSFRNVKEFFPEIELNMVPDSVFHMNDDIGSNASERFGDFVSNLGAEPYFCFSIPILLSKIKNYYRQPKDYSPIGKLITELKKVVPNAVIMSKEPNESFLEKIAEDTGSIYFGPEYSYADLMSLLKNAKFLVSGRYHHLIFSTLVGCPAIPLTSSSHKIHGLCELLGDSIGILPIDSTDLFSNINRIIERAITLCNEHTTYQQRIRDKVVHLQKEADTLGDIIEKNL